MISDKHILYLFKDVIQVDNSLLEQLKIAVNADTISIHASLKSYTEGAFNFESPEINDSDKNTLDAITESVIKCGQNTDALSSLFIELAEEEIPFLKLIHFFINEHYFKTSLTYDNHGRVLLEAVRDEYKAYLNYPIADVLASALIHKLGLRNNMRKKLIFTCDYDIINIWDALGIYGSFKRLAKRLVYLNFYTFFREAYSVLFSHQWLHANYMLNTGMYYMELENECKKLRANIEIDRIAFFLMSYTHKEYDIDNNFEALSFKSFQELLKQEGIQTGIHPAYETINTPALVAPQMDKFKTVFKQNAELNRFHFLHCNYPDCLEMLEIRGIKTDYSFYFTENVNVFRGGTTRKFKMWDYTNDKVFNIDIIPITIMECSLDQYMGLDYTTAVDLSKRKLSYAYTLGQNICLLWHNTQIYYGQTERDNYQYQLFGELKKHLLFLLSSANA